MKVVVRTDASLQIGTGHVMRCLTLADALKARGAECDFICREHTGHLLDLIRQRGHTAHGLSVSAGGNAQASRGDSLPMHAAWLCGDWRDDAAQTHAILKSIQPDWLVVDHYALDARWERSVRLSCHNLMVVDDLADRQHDCDLLLDQTLGRTAEEYQDLVPVDCAILVGAKYALLRPEFTALREYSLKRRGTPRLESILISMGGVDQQNATSLVLNGLKACPLPNGTRITVVLGKQSPWLNSIKEQASHMPWRTEVRENAADMAQLMADSDLAIGAAGSTSWERCCLGLPTLMVVLAENQRMVASALVRCGAAYLLGDISEVAFDRAIRDGVFARQGMVVMSVAASNVTDGNGVGRVVGFLDEIDGKKR
jgi:UDP-2,4-diacetamido-2,4,6-trideoxy-beta-L-altropyranose hydrolase